MMRVLLSVAILLVGRKLSAGKRFAHKANPEQGSYFSVHGVGSSGPEGRRDG